ncbi:Exostoses (Multiple)-like 3 [Chytriomyces hyalinus]|nr:Exostoses (Multiple)-like 3 [Chytriomyces hyalinus]
MCIIGEANTHSDVEEFQRLWDLAFPGFFNIPSTQSMESSVDPRMNWTPVFSADAVAFPESILAAVEQASMRYTCENYMILTSNLNQLQFLSSKLGDNMAASLSTILDEYWPAIAAFSHTLSSTERPLAKVQALAGVDTRVVILHHSILPLLIHTQHPTEMGGGHLQHFDAFTNLASALLFQESALQINTIHLSPPNAKPAKSPPTDSALLHLGRRSGESLEDYDIYWEPTLQSAQCSSPLFMNKTLIAPRIASLFNLQHPYFANNPWIASYATANTLHFKVHIFTPFHRSNNFDRLYESINLAKRIHSRVSIHVHVDSFNSTADSKKTLKFLQSLQSRHGPVLVHVHAVRVKEFDRSHSRDATNLWMPTQKNEFAIFLGEQTVASERLFEYAEASTLAYFFNHTASKQVERLGLMGISLVNTNVSLGVDAGTPFLFQQPNEDAILFAPEPWIEFVKWKMQLPVWIDPLIPDSPTNSWPRDSWAKYLLRFMVQHGKTLLFSNCVSPLATINSQTHANSLPVSPFPPLESLKSFDAYKRQTTLTLSLGEAVASFDVCTMVMQVYSRTSTFLDRLAHYHTLPFLSSIIIVWNNLNTPPPAHINHPESNTFKPNAPTFAIPIHILQQPQNSMNNRFKPFKELGGSQCVIAMDDDWDFPHAKLVAAIRAWQTGGYERLVGFQQQGRVHVPSTAKKVSLSDLRVSGIQSDAVYAKEAVSVKHKYGKNVQLQKAGVSILMPSATVYHAKYHHMYTYALPERARAVVQELTNCDDILFNMMVANATHAGPVVLADGDRVEKALVFDKAGQIDGLWKDKEHWAKRLWCMNYFVEHVFDGKMPLISTRVVKGRKRRRGDAVKAKRG